MSKEDSSLAPQGDFGSTTHLDWYTASSLMTDAEEFISFLDEPVGDEPVQSPALPWKLLIVDDEPQVHEATELALRRIRIGDRPLHFLHAYSAAEAETLIQRTEGIDLVLLDVIMETPDAGLRLVDRLRGGLGLSQLKILIRSGQPGSEQERDLAGRFPVNGYLQKTQQTASHLVSVISALLLNEDGHATRQD